MWSRLSTGAHAKQVATQHFFAM